MITKLIRQLEDQQEPQGTWQGRLSSSALATAVSAFALHRLDPDGYAPVIRQALRWLADHANPDGAWGDTPRSRSNLSTTLLCWSALTTADQPDVEIRTAADAAAAWLVTRTGDLSPPAIATGILDHYGPDRTFSVPILTMCALSGRLGENIEAWDLVPQLPFELAALPGCLFRWIRMPVVSYALPALIAIGLVRHHCRRSRLPLLARLRDRLISRVLGKLKTIQPRRGGFLEAPPLTAFVVMSLCAAGEKQHPVVTRGVDFLLKTVREDGSWPIDTNLRTWVTTQAVQAVAGLPPATTAEILGAGKAVRLRDWLLQTQTVIRHPYTGAAPGGWAWTDLPGGVPDGDDTAGALLTLRILTEKTDARWEKVRAAAREGIRWLLDIQNRDGGIPTFCRGWGTLPFDRSCTDITAHFIRAVLEWRPELPPSLYRRTRQSLTRATAYLVRSQNRDGSWTPLWFGNEATDKAENRTYGTARVVMALQPLTATEFAVQVEDSLNRGLQWLLANRNDDGGWGAAAKVPSTIEETALAVQALSKSRNVSTRIIESGRQWLVHNIHSREPLPAAPIGLYFARLWYWEQLYPVIFSLNALTG